MSRVAILQSNYIPWKGYFDIIHDVDLFIFYDDDQYTMRDWRNRNRIKTRAGLSWVTVPVRRDGLSTRIEDARIDWRTDWTARHRHVLLENYRDAPFVREISDGFFAVLDRRHDRLSALNVELMRWIADCLSIRTEVVLSSSLEASGNRTDRLVDLVTAVGGNTYLSGPSAEAYLDLAAFDEAGIAVEFKTYDYAPYPQLWGEFEGAVSVLDLMLNIGPDARAHLKSKSANRTVSATRAGKTGSKQS